MFLNCLAPCATAGVAASVALATATVAPTTFRNFLRSLAIFYSLRICRHQYFRRPLSGMRPSPPQEVRWTPAASFDHLVGAGHSCPEYATHQAHLLLGLQYHIEWRLSCSPYTGETSRLDNVGQPRFSSLCAERHSDFLGK